MRLSDCLSKNSSVLGFKCEELGKKKSSFFSGKTFLSYNKDGWEVLELNIVQLFFRKVLGAYKSTHLDYITKKINKLPITEDLKDCYARIEALWIKKNLIALGNNTLSEAGIICFGEKHGDKCYRAVIAELINATYREGDIVLVEGVEADQEIAPSDHQLTKKVKSSCVVRGWEPKNFEEISGLAFKKSSAKYEEVKELFNYFRDSLELKDNFTDEEIALLEVKLDDLIDKINSLNQYYKSKSKVILGAAKILKDVFEKFKKGTLAPDGKHGILLYAVILNILVKLEKKQEKAISKNITSEELAQIIKGIPLRNISLINQINKYRAEGRKVFVITGLFHLLEFQNQHALCKEVKEYLKSDRFVVITRKRDFTNRIKKLNSDLESVQFLEN